MKYLLSLFILFFVACGTKNAASNIQNNRGDLVESSAAIGYSIPSDATVMDYNCDTSEEFLRDSNPSVEHILNKGTQYTWERQGLSYRLEVGARGNYKNLTKTQRTETIDQITKFLKISNSSRRSGKWQTIEREIIRVYSKITNEVLSNIVNGVNTPYYWQQFTHWIDENTLEIIYQHKKPEIRNTPNKAYTKITETCVFKKKSGASSAITFNNGANFYSGVAN